MPTEEDRATSQWTAVVRALAGRPAGLAAVAVFAAATTLGYTVPSCRDIPPLLRALNTAGDVPTRGTAEETLTRLKRRHVSMQARLDSLHARLAGLSRPSRTLGEILVSAERENVIVKALRHTAGGGAGGFDVGRDISLEVEGRFHAVAALINRLERSSLPLLVLGFDVSREPNAVNLSAVIDLRAVALEQPVRP